jgi:hypothetical protein
MVLKIQLVTVTNVYSEFEFSGLNVLEKIFWGIFFVLKFPTHNKIPESFCCIKISSLYLNPNSQLVSKFEFELIENQSPILSRQKTIIYLNFLLSITNEINKKHIKFFPN